MEERKRQGTIRIELKQLLDARGMTQADLAEKAGLRPVRISQICRGYIDRLELSHIVKICDALKVTPNTWIVYEGEWMQDEA